MTDSHVSPPPPANAAVRAWRAGERERIVPRLIAVTAGELATGAASIAGHVLTRLIDAHASERRRLAAGHWSASPRRLWALAEAIAAEAAALGEADDGPADAPSRPNAP